MCLFFLVFCLFVLLVRPVCFSCSSACCASPSSSSFYSPRFFVTMFVFLVFFALVTPFSFLFILFSCFFSTFVLSVLPFPSRSPSPFCSQEVRSISPFFRLATLDRLSYIYIYMYIYMVSIYIYMVYILPFFAQESRSWWMAPRCIWRAWPGIRCPRAVRTLQTWTSPQR